MKEKRIVTVGTFDGMHPGHRLVLDTLRQEGKLRGLSPLVITFDRHPLETVAPDRAPGLLMSNKRKMEEFDRIDMPVVTLQFDRTMAATTVEEWLHALRREHDAEAVVVGYDNTFGSDGASMNVADYRRIASAIGLDLIEAPICKNVSSSAIRRAVAEGRMEDAAALLGHPYEISGVVVHGEGRGKSLGFPTANIRPDYRAQLPLAGVYAGVAVTPDNRRHPAVVNVGRHPTVGAASEVTIEAHLPLFDADLYGKPLLIAFIKRLRDERKFPDLASLKAAIRGDIEQSLALLDN